MKRRKVIGWFVVVFSLLIMFVGGPLMKMIFGMPLWPAVMIGLFIMFGGFRLTKGKTLF